MTRPTTYAAASLLALLLAVKAPVPAAPASADPPTCDGLPATIVGTDGDDTLVGTAGPDVIVGLGGHDRLQGLGGADRLCGGSGADALVADAYDTVAPGTSRKRDTLDYSTSATGLVVDLSSGDVWIGSGAATGHVTVTSDVRLVGTAYPDLLFGTDRDDVIEPGLSADQVYAGDGDDIVTDADRGSDHTDKDIYHGQDGNDLLDGGWGADRLNGGLEADTLVDEDGSSVLNGAQGPDLITTSIRVATPVGQTVDGGGGVDSLVIRHVWKDAATLARPVGTVDLRVSIARVETRGPRTTSMRVRTIENVQVNDGHWTLVGDDAENVLEGGLTRSSHVDIRAGGGDDVLRGTRHDDLLDGGRGFDRAVRSAGDDRYVSVERIR